MTKRGVEARQKGSPYRTSTPEKKAVYHIRPECPRGKKILPAEIHSGGYGRVLCNDCAALIYAEIHALVTPK